METSSSLEVFTSQFLNVKSPHPFCRLVLLDYLRSCSIKPNPLLVRTILALRACTDEEQRKRIKLSLPAVTPSALLKSRCANLKASEKVEQMTGFMQFDIDLKDNPAIYDAGMLRDRLIHNKFIAYCSLSASGKGVWGLVKVSRPELLNLHFEQLKLDFSGIGITIDPSKGGNPTDLRLYSYDPEAYIASTFEKYDRLTIPSWKCTTGQRGMQPSLNTQEIVEHLISIIQMNNVDIAPEYGQYMSLGFAFVNSYGESGRDLFHAVCRPHKDYDPMKTDKQYDECIERNDGRIHINTFIYYCRQAGIPIPYK